MNPFEEIHVGFQSRRCQNHDDKPSHLAVPSNPPEYFHRWHVRDVQIQQNQAGDGKPFTVGEFMFAKEILQGFPAIMRDLRCTGNANLGKSALHEENVVLVILNEQNRRVYTSLAFS
jgi:hypothetical protein